MKGRTHPDGCGSADASFRILTCSLMNMSHRVSRDIS